MGLSAGNRLGPYEIVEALGAGGMGEVYRARDTKLNREVALKVLPELFALDPDRLTRFKREAQVLASLNHPNIAVIHGFEESTGVQALVLELVEGPTLADRIAQGPIPIDDALHIARQIADALEAAHEQGVIHRDLKPANIKLRPDGTVKVLDFGLAKALEPGGAGLPPPHKASADRRSLGGGGQTGPSALSQSPTITTPAMTQMGVILGTAAYMSPEQAKGRAADKRSDVWAFGCVLYEMLTGKRAFEGEDVSDTLAAVFRGEPDWKALPPDVPVSIRALVQRCLEKDRKRRIADISTALFVIDEPTMGPSPAATAPPRALWRRAIPMLVAAMLAGAIVGLAMWNFRRSPSLTVTRFPFTLGEGQQFTNAGRNLIAISPDGTQIVYVANTRLYVRSMSDVDARPIPGSEVTQGLTSPVFSPDGRSVAFHSGADQTLKRIAVSGGAAVTICPASNPFGMSWDTDGIVFGQGRNGIMRVSPNGGKPELLVSVKSDEVAHGPQILPGGKAVLFTLATDAVAGSPGAGSEWDKARIVVQSLKSGERKILIDGGSDGRYVPTGHIVYALGGVLFAAPFDVRKLQVSGGPVPIVEGVRRSGATGTAQFSFAKNGSLVYVPGPVAESGQQDLALIDRAGTVEPLKLQPGSYGFARVSPDGKRLAVGTDDGKVANVWIYDLGGSSSIRQLTFGGRNRFPIWSADGQRVAFQSDREGDPAIFWQRADGTGTAERLTKPEQETSHIPDSWSPNGEQFLFDVIRGSTVSLSTFSLRDKKAAAFGGVVKIETSGTGLHAMFSPDGRWVAYTSNESRTLSVFVQPFPSTGAKYLVTAGFHPLWSPDGKELFITRGPRQHVVVSITTEPRFAFGNPAPVPQLGSIPRGPGGPRSYDITPDGKRFVDVVASGFTQSGAPTSPQIQIVLNPGSRISRSARL